MATEKPDTSLHNIGSYLLVTIQVTTIVYLVASHTWYPFDQWLKVPVAAGGLIALWAIYAMKKRSRIHILPVLLPGSNLVTSGPYRWVRHPMYTSLLVIFIPFVIADFDPARLIALVLMTAVLIAKLTREEKQLREAFADYDLYARKTFRIIPWIY